jgi:hypothetical protein
VYKLDIRDEGQPPISWSTALAFGAIAFDPTMSTTTALLAGSKALAAQSSPGSAPTASTQCHWYITDNLASAKEFISTKGTITDTKSCYRTASNITQETREIQVSGDTTRLYVCVNNNNATTAATATLSVSALVKMCE